MVLQRHSKLTCEDKYNQCDDGPPVLDLARRQRIAVALSHVDDGGFVEQDRDDVRCNGSLAEI